MQILQVTDEDIVRLEKCQHCGRRVRPGQVVLVQHGYSESYVSRDFVIHVRCIRALLEEAPPEHDEVAYQELKERIVTTGRAFPET